jgi:hypothetical protein|uniref:Atp8 n=1 Tax=Ostreococcus tauri TaxID=70448 RepID=S5M4B6_OSTTA|nr:Atp8 [Ostreococcus tauri]AGR42893.1 Atp8 [Ostreococcus tauri]AGR43045.1 Atp8 [Ostreococcus tauri]AGR43065.1 Atp8 [Ostreococcus tauri]AGR43131.1 Atp8 [Ostreococcus tauri]
MPQLDMVTFFPQFFWFCLFFTGFYLTLVQKYLPQLTRIFAVREAAQQTTPTDLTTDACEALAQKTHKVFSDSVQETKKKYTQQFQTTTQLLDIQTDAFNTHTHQAFEKYQSKKIMLQQTVQYTLQHMHHVLPGTQGNMPKVDATKTAHFFSQALVQKLCVPHNQKK